MTNEMIKEYFQYENDFLTETEEQYQALLRSLHWIDGFGLIFVRCLPVERHKIIAKIKSDIPSKNIQVLSLNESDNDFYELLTNIEKVNDIQILFIENIETLLYG